MKIKYKGAIYRVENLTEAQKKQFEPEIKKAQEKDELKEHKAKKAKEAEQKKAKKA